MKKLNLLRLAVAALAASAFALGAAGPASASGPVTWENKGTPWLCLNGSPGRYVFLQRCLIDSDSKNWVDVMYPDHGNNYIQYLGSNTNYCLDSNNNGSVYVSWCNPSSQYNKYQFWSEEKWNGGWVLKNVGTQRCLAAERDGNFWVPRTVPCRAGNDLQYWK